jgi:hypothetical protein
MLSLHILARKFKLDLVNNTERELVGELRRENFKILKERAFKTNPEGVYERLAGSNVHVGDKSGNFEIYYISNPNEVRVLAENKFDLDKADEAKITRTKYVYLLHSEIPCYLFKIGYDYREWNNFLYGRMEGILYENTKGIMAVNELLFKYIGYLPVLASSGLVTTLIEVAVDKATEKAVEVILPDSQVGQFLAGLAFGFSGVKSLRPPKANKILREQELEALSETGARFRGTTNPGTDLNDILTGAKQRAVRGADITPSQRANTPLVDTILDKLPIVEDFAAKTKSDEWNRLGQALPTKGTPRTIGESAQQHLPSAISRRLGTYAKREINPDYPVLGMAQGTDLPPYPEWSSKFIHDYFAKEVLGRKAKEKVFKTSWSASRGLGTRRFDDFDKGVGMEFNTQPWSVMGQAKLSKKIEQVGSDWTLLRENKKVKKIIWVGSEPLPTSGLGAKLAKALSDAGIPYWHVPLP